MKLTDRWGTPDGILKQALQYFNNRIDLDVASDEQSNQRIKATRFFSQDGQSQVWHDNVWCNPPYSTPLVNEFTDKATKSLRGCNILFLCNFDYSTKRCQQLMKYSLAVCLLENRVGFLHPETKTPINNNSRAQAIFCLGELASFFAFHEAFKNLGLVIPIESLNEPFRTDYFKELKEC